MGARDQHTGAPVALKLLRGRSAAENERFVREASLLADLAHPGIVRFVAAGVTPANERYLVMEWLDGEDLDARLARGALTLVAPLRAVGLRSTRSTRAGLDESEPATQRRACREP